MSIKAHFREMKRVLDTGGGAGGTTMQMHSMPLNCALHVVTMGNFMLLSERNKKRKQPPASLTCYGRWEEQYACHIVS